MSTLSEELSLMLSCLRESQLQAAQQSQCRTVAPASRSADSAAQHAVRRRYDVCFTRAEWRMTEADGQIGLADLLLVNFLYTKLSHDDDSGYHQLELGAFKVRLLLLADHVWLHLAYCMFCLFLRTRVFSCH